MSNKPIHVTQPSLATMDEFNSYLKEVWQSGILTHNGPLVKRFEAEISKLLSIKNFVTVSNGTIALQMAIKALQLKGEIITTPFTWIATISAIQWEGCTPIFCDIDQKTLNIDVNKIEELITEKTVAIMPVHVFGNPCDVKSIQKIADKYNLKVIYDAAHAIGSTVDNKSIFEFGDISTTSLHATKLLNTAEGGGCITNDDSLNLKLQRIRFFGHSDDKSDIVEQGLNAKMTEIHAALGLANLIHYQDVLDDRKQKYFIYKKLLAENNDFVFQELKFGKCNYSYFPIIFKSEDQLLKIQRKLNSENIFPRRYFYPSVNTYTNIVEYNEMPISEDISKRILCMPLYYTLGYNELEKIAKITLNES